MKKTRRILAMIGVILLVVLYLSTLFFAITDRTASLGYFKASIAATILVPVLLWAYTMIYKLVKPDSNNDDSDESSTDQN